MSHVVFEPYGKTDDVVVALVSGPAFLAPSIGKNAQSGRQQRWTRAIFLYRQPSLDRVHLRVDADDRLEGGLRSCANVSTTRRLLSVSNPNSVGLAHAFLRLRLTS